MTRIPTDEGKLGRVNLSCQGALKIFVVQIEELLGGGGGAAGGSLSFFKNICVL